MGRASIRKNKSYYQLVREELGYTREEAAEKTESLGLPLHRLTRVETGEVTMMPEDVVAMSKAYNDPAMRNYYCTHECPIGRLDVPEISVENIHEILVNLSVSIEQLNESKGRLMEILVDEKVQKAETEDFNRIQKELERISMTVEALQAWCEKMKPEV